MYLKLRQLCFLFEMVQDINFNYFNILDYQIYSPEERQELINTGTYEINDFLLIPQIDRNEIVAKYLLQKNKHHLLGKRHSNGFYCMFHRYIEDNHLATDWNEYEISELINYASVWCEQNQIMFTTK